ncbi:MAG TPA: hypothetical protein VLB09_03690 [Nitrospiria bacterium]|nr:hypothetical protein [Nitrospiria bacterium]
MTMMVGEIVEIYTGVWTKMARVRVAGAYTRTALAFVPDAEIGDTVLMEGRVAISVEKKIETGVS